MYDCRSLLVQVTTTVCYGNSRKRSVVPRFGISKTGITHGGLVGGQKLLRSLEILSGWFQLSQLPAEITKPSLI